MTQAERIKDRLRACTTPQEIHAVADEERAAVLELAKDPETKPLAIQIANLKAYRLADMRKSK
jgi:uncharacterized protein GlcG (DUF336 family)